MLFVCLSYFSFIQDLKTNSSCLNKIDFKIQLKKKKKRLHKNGSDCNFEKIFPNQWWLGIFSSIKTCHMLHLNRKTQPFLKIYNKKKIVDKWKAGKRNEKREEKKKRVQLYQCRKTFCCAINFGHVWKIMEIIWLSGLNAFIM